MIARSSSSRGGVLEPTQLAAMRRLRERPLAAASNAEEETGGNPYPFGVAGTNPATGQGV